MHSPKRFEQPLLVALVAAAASLAGCRATTPPTRQLGPASTVSAAGIEAVSDSGLSVVLEAPSHVVLLELRGDASPRLLYAPTGDSPQPLGAGRHEISFFPDAALDVRAARVARASHLKSRLVTRGPERQCVGYLEGEPGYESPASFASTGRRVCGWTLGSQPLTEAGRRYSAPSALLVFSAPRLAVPSVADLGRRVSSLAPGTSPETAGNALAGWLLSSSEAASGWAGVVRAIR